MCASTKEKVSTIQQRALTFKPDHEKAANNTFHLTLASGQEYVPFFGECTTEDSASEIFNFSHGIRKEAVQKKTHLRCWTKLTQNVFLHLERNFGLFGITHADPIWLRSAAPKLPLWPTALWKTKIAQFKTEGSSYAVNVMRENPQLDRKDRSWTCLKDHAWHWNWFHPAISVQKILLQSCVLEQNAKCATQSLIFCQCTFDNTVKPHTLTSMLLVSGVRTSEKQTGLSLFKIIVTKLQLTFQKYSRVFFVCFFQGGHTFWLVCFGYIVLIHVIIVVVIIKVAEINVERAVRLHANLTAETQMILSNFARLEKQFFLQTSHRKSKADPMQSVESFKPSKEQRQHRSDITSRGLPALEGFSTRWVHSSRSSGAHKAFALILDLRTNNWSPASHSRDVSFERCPVTAAVLWFQMQPESAHCLPWKMGHVRWAKSKL